MYDLVIEDPIFTELEFNHRWIEAGIVTCDNFSLIKQQYLTGEDRCSEHYRWGAFKSFMNQNKTIDGSSFQILYDLGERDSNPAMGRAILFDLITRLDCPLELIDRAIATGDFTLSKHAVKCKVIRQGDITKK